jgi:hypothetical protein
MNVKIFPLLILAVGLVSSCNENEEVRTNTILSQKWKLAAVLYDPGDGSGVFQPTSSDKTLTFFNDSTVSSNGSLCNASENTDAPSTGRYNATTKTITPTSCNADRAILYSMSDTVLILYYPCIELCAEKYVPVN